MVRAASGRGTVALLALAQAFTASAGVLAMTVAAIVGAQIAPDKGLATLPIALTVVGTALATVPASLYMQRFGRRAGFLLGALAGVAGGLFSAWAIVNGSFVLFCTGHFLVGVFQGFENYCRFAAAEAASEDWRGRAISWVLLGGVVAAIVGPEMAGRFRDSWPPHTFAASYLAQAGLAFLAGLAVAGVSIAKPARTARDAARRPLRAIARQPAFVVAVVGATVGYAVMVAAMTATPLAMLGCGLPVADAVVVIQWHVLAMFVPSFFTGSLVERFGAERVLAAGIALLIVHAAIAASGLAFAHFLSALVFLGVGWNFAFVAGTTLLATSCAPEDRARAQALNEALVFGSVALASFSSGWALAQWDWRTLNLALLPPLIGAGVLAIGAARRRR